jgi:superfamily II DNA or RNA helicase
MKVFKRATIFTMAGITDPIGPATVERPGFQEIPLPTVPRLQSGAILRAAEPSANLAATLAGARVSPPVTILATAATDSMLSTEIPVPEVFPWSLAPDERPVTSHNLVDPLKPCGVLGTRYQKDLDGSAQKSLFEVEKADPPSYVFPRKAYQETLSPDGLTRHKRSIWDLIYPVLLPPLLLDFVGQLDLPREPWPHQRTGVDFLIGHESALLGDEMGTGKTATTVLATRLLFRQGKIRKALVVCPLITLRSWDKHFFEWAPEIDVTVVRGGPDQRKVDWESPAHVYITTYDTLRSDARAVSGFLEDTQVAAFDLVALDEAQRIKNPDSKQSRVVRRFSPTYRWAVTGTPFETKVEDLAAIFSFVKPGYMRPDGLKAGEAKELLDPYFRRIRKADVLKDLPPKIREEEWLDLDEEQRRAYDDALSAGRDHLANLGQNVMRPHIFALIQKLKQICNFAPDKNGSPKARSLSEKVKEVIEEGHKVVVFTQFVKEGLEKLQKLLHKHGVVKLQGGMSERQQEEALSRFRNDDTCKVFLGSLRAAGMGLDGLQHASSYVIHFDHWWNPAVMWQAEDRVHRAGQNAPVNVYALWMSDTIEERIYKKLKDRGLLFEQIVDSLSDEQVDGLISTEEWLEMLGVPLGERKKDVEPAPIRERSKEFVLLENLEKIDPLEFETVVQKLFQALNYGVRTTQRSNDGGVDLLLSRRTFGGEERSVVQCKRTKTVGVEVARELLGVIENDRSITKGFIVTSGHVSPQCRSFCENNGRLGCLSGPEVAKYIVEFGLAEAIPGLSSSNH